MTLQQHASSMFLWSIATLMGTTIVAGCSDGGPVTVTSGYGKGIKFSGLGPTYAWSPSPSMDRANPALGSAEFGELVRKVVENELAAKGYTPASAGPANFWVDYRIGRQKKTDSGVNPHGEVFGEGSLQLDVAKLRLGFVVYGALNRKDWRTVSVEDVSFDADELINGLLPVLRTVDAEQLAEPATWAGTILNECRQGLSMVLPLADPEREFLDRILDCGEIVPALLTSDPDMAHRIASQPMLQWKAQNVRQHKTREA